MNTKEPTTLKEINAEIKRLSDLMFVMSDPIVQAAIRQVRERNAPRVKELQARADALRSKRKELKRWPDDTPTWVLDLCKKYWSGTEELHKFRIHLWNEKAAWTSWPSGGYSTMGGWVPVSPTYFLISRTALAEQSRPKVLKELGFDHGSKERVTKEMMQAELDKLK